MTCYTMHAQAGQTALMIAAGRGHTAIVQELLEHGAKCVEPSEGVRPHVELILLIVHSFINL
jgi:hypothetical protein